MAIRREDIPSNSSWLGVQDIKNEGGTITDDVDKVELVEVTKRDGKGKQIKPAVYLRNHKPWLMGPDNQARFWDLVDGRTDDMESISKIKLGLHKVRNPNGPGMVDGVILQKVALRGEPQHVVNRPRNLPSRQHWPDEPPPAESPDDFRGRDDIGDEIPF
jgi:hypothetical protein